MSQTGSRPSKFRKKLRQSEIEDDPQSLTAKAFRRRILDEETDNPLTTGTATQAPKIAVYRDKTAPLRRNLIRIGLIFIAPIVAIGIILLIVFGAIQDNANKVVPVVETESIALQVIPVPGGVRPISRALNLNQKRSAEIYFDRTLPQYLNDFKGAATYISGKSKEEIKKFYDSKLVEPKPPPWQTFGNPLTSGSFYTVLYLRALTNGPPGSIEALVLQIEPVSRDILKKDPEYYDLQAKEGENVIILWKSWLVPR